ncbi:hypothetical protein LCGC14_2266230 [marine sediment metagenome]|uniref:Uncharacterized protein n=1 Tax=marine sediment metagenome TaxID=412755 RepID=A0A0F9DKJ2_9ZZZZ
MKRAILLIIAVIFFITMVSLHRAGAEPSDEPEWDSMACFRASKAQMIAVPCDTINQVYGISGTTNHITRRRK